MKPKITSLQTTETLKQLDGDFWSSVRNLPTRRNNYFRKPNTEKVEPQEDFIRLLQHIEGLMNQMTLKIINHSVTVAKSIANEVLSTKDEKKRQQGILRLRKLVQIFRSLKEDAGIGIEMSRGLGNQAAFVGDRVESIRSDTESKLALIIRMGQQARQQKGTQRKAA
ncbi:MAG: hypothetical protein AABX63_00055 [Nanoarchaeota archaeon]